MKLNKDNYEIEFLFVNSNGDYINWGLDNKQLWITWVSLYRKAMREVSRALLRGNKWKTAVGMKKNKNGMNWNQ